MQTNEIQELLLDTIPAWHYWFARPFKRMLNDGVSLDMYYCIQSMRRSNRTMTMTELANFARMPKQQMSKLADKLVHAAVDVVERIRIGQIEHLLSAALQRQSASGGRENPIRVVTGHIGIGVDHFRLEPQAEFHTLGVHVVGERLQGLRAIGPDVLRNLPVTEAGGVVAAGTEPAVVRPWRIVPRRSRRPCRRAPSAYRSCGRSTRLPMC